MPNKYKNFIGRILILFPLFVVSVFSFAVVYSVFASDITPSKVIDLTNRARSGKSLNALLENPKLSQAADAKARDMIKNDYFAHTSPSGKDPWHWMKKAGYEYKAAGENLAINFTDAQEQQSAWMESKTHRANILNGQYKEIGVAVVEGRIDGQSSIVTVQMFGTPIIAPADQVKTVVPPVQKAPSEIKGTETVVEKTNISDVDVQNVPEVVPVFPTEQIIEKSGAPMSQLDIAALIAAVILALVALAAPVVFIVAAYALLAVSLRKNMTEMREASDNHNMEYHFKGEL